MLNRYATSLDDLYNPSTDAEYASTPLESPIPPPTNTYRPQIRRGGDRNDRSFNGGTSNTRRVEEPTKVIPSQEKNSGLDFSSFASKLMEQSGWKTGQGIGKIDTPPVEKPYRYPMPEGFQERRHTISLERLVPFRQELNWLINPDHQPIDNVEKKLFIASRSDLQWESYYAAFCDTELVHELSKMKDRLKTVPREVFERASNKANFYSEIGQNIFMDKSAVTLANLDFLLKLTSETSISSFGDINGGPGGFSEYLLWRKKSNAVGWGMTIKRKDDWNLRGFHSDAPTANFLPVYGEDNTGDVTMTSNIKYFAQVAKGQDNEGLSLVVANGGIDEVNSKQTILCEVLVAFLTLKQHGNFLCRIFNVFSPFTVGLVYLLYRHFEKVCIVKPYACNQINSERYIYCGNLLERRPAIVEYLFEVNDRFRTLKKNEDILHLVDESLYKEDKLCIDYIRRSNISISKIQLENLDILIKYIEDRQLDTIDKTERKIHYLKEWNLPIDVEKRGRESDASSDPSKRVRNSYQETSNWAPHQTQQRNNNSTISSHHDSHRRVSSEIPEQVEAPKKGEQFQLNAKTLAALEKYKKK